MRIILIATMMAFATISNGQSWNSPPTNVPKENYGVVIIYRQWNQYSERQGDALTFRNKWEYKFKGFKDVKEALEWLNTPAWYQDSKHPSVSITADELIGIYDLTKSSEIKVTLLIEKKSKPKQVVIESDEWVEKHYEIKTN